MRFVEVEAKVRLLAANLGTIAPDAHDSRADFVLRRPDFEYAIGSYLQSFLESFSAARILLLKTVRANAMRREGREAALWQGDVKHCSLIS